MPSDEQATLAYTNLGPDDILTAIESVGYACSGALFALNSYENRVYQIGLKDDTPIIAKFYRPHRWSDDAILEEHAFAEELEALEIPVVAPIRDDGASLHIRGLHRFALFPQRGGRAPELDNTEHLEQLGRFIGRIHAAGAVKPFGHRYDLSIERMGVQSAAYLLDHNFIPIELTTAYRSLCDDLIIRIQQCFDQAGSVQSLRLHGDCHPGNILWQETGPHIVDLDDTLMGPAIQDLWMFLSGDRTYMTARLADLLDGYTRFYDFNPAELHLVEALRTLRLMNYAAWLARRWQDPAFPQAFPWFNTPTFWDEHVLMLREQAALMEEPPLIWD